MMIRPVNRLVMLGLSGVSTGLLKSCFEKDLMPNLAALWRASAGGTLLAGQPPSATASWAGILSGNPPQVHGVYDYDCVVPRLHGVRPADHRSFWVPHLWQILSDQGHRIVSLQVPMTYSMKNVNGLIVSGSDSPSSRSVWHGDESVVNAVRQSVPNWSHKSRWKQRPGSTEELLLEIQRFERHLIDLGRLADAADKAVDWTVFCVRIQDLDALQYTMWPELVMDEESPGMRPEWSSLIQNVMKSLDDLIGRLVRMADRDQAGVMVLSDSGFGPCRALVNVNGILRVHGIQRGHSLGGRIWQAGGRVVDRAGRWISDSMPSAGYRHRLRPMQIMAPCDRSRSLAFAPFGRTAGLVYLTDRARRVESKTERITQEVAEILRLIADPETAEPIFSTVVPVANRWSIDPVATGWPDIVAIPADGYHPLARWGLRDKVRLLAKDANVPGTIRPDGIVAMLRSGLAPEQRIKAQVQDIAPTVLKWLGMPESGTMSGRVIGTPETTMYQPHIRPGSTRIVIDSGARWLAAKNHQTPS